MKLTDALENERNRTSEESWNKVFLHKDGKFYHIYEWSAWLVKTYICTEEFQRERGDAKLLLAQLYNTKNASYVILGFPIESLSKYIPNYENATQLENGDIILEIELPDAENVTYEELQSNYEEFRNTCPIKENKKHGNFGSQGNVNNAVLMSRSGIFNILSQVLSYPVEKSTPTQNIDFISNLKQQVAALL